MKVAATSSLTLLYNFPATRCDFKVTLLRSIPMWLWWSVFIACFITWQNMRLITVIGASLTIRLHLHLHDSECTSTAQKLCALPHVSEMRCDRASRLYCKNGKASTMHVSKMCGKACVFLQVAGHSETFRRQRMVSQVQRVLSHIFKMHSKAKHAFSYGLACVQKHEDADEW